MPPPLLTCISVDSMFIATIFASDEDQVTRYADEAKMTEQCKWKIDLASLPAFRQNVSLNKSSGFYTGNVLQRLTLVRFVDLLL